MVSKRTREVCQWKIRFSGICVLWVCLCVTGHSESTAISSKKNPTQVSEIVSLLKQANVEPVVLTGDNKNQVVIVTPKLVGRVICAGMDGIAGHTNAFVNAKQIIDGFSASGYAARSEPEAGWNNFGGCERIWFAPEGGPYGFFFEPSVEQNWHNYLMSYPLQSVQYKTTDKSHDGKSVTFKAPIKMTNYAGHNVSLEVTRQIALLESCPFAIGLESKADFVGFESQTWARNTGDKALDKHATPTAIWTLGIFHSGPQVVVLLPYKQGEDSQLGEPVTTEYFRYFLAVDKDDENLAKHWSVEDGCVLVKSDGTVQLKLEMLKRRSLGRLASVDLAKNELTIVDFEMYPELDYAASFFTPYDGDLLNGGVLSTFMLAGEPLSAERPAFYELEVCSPIMELRPNEQFCHVSRTYTIRADRKSIMQICERFFNVNDKTLTDFNKRSR